MTNAAFQAAEVGAVPLQEAETCDVLIIGGGPAGSTAAALLAAEGRDVVLLEQGSHPRFHIGESLLPRNLEILERLGVLDQVASMGVYKPGAEFIADDTGRSVRFPFSLQPNARFKYAFQVRRAEFDQMLFETAGAKGARSFEQTRVTVVELGAQMRVLAERSGQQICYAPRYILDASGRDTFLAGKLGLKSADKRNNTAAVFAHYRAVEARPEESCGYITVHLSDDGWFWSIPLPDDVTSIGFVGMPGVFKNRQGSMDALLEQRIAASPTLSARMTGAERVSPVTSTANYSYKCSTGWGEGYGLIGDAFAFVDPVFSSGVLLAMNAGELGAKVASAWLDDPQRARVLARQAESEQRRSMATISWLIYRINTPVLRALFMEPRNFLRMRDGLVSMLAGNFRLGWSGHIPVLAFKAIYYTMLLSQHLGRRRRAAAA